MLASPPPAAVQLVDSPRHESDAQPAAPAGAVLAEPRGERSSMTLQAAQSGALQIRDFGFDDEDPRHHGQGSVLPGDSAVSVWEVLYDFVAESGNELSATKGTQLYVLREVDAGWVLARSVDGEQGLVPGAYLQKVEER